LDWWNDGKEDRDLRLEIGDFKEDGMANGELPIGKKLG
jgi:hypothetical protein